MIRNIFSVSAITLVSRLFGFVRDLMFAAILGAGPLADAFFVAFRIPNQFRAIFAEGAFSAAFVPGFAKVAAERGQNAALVFADRIFAFLILAQLVLLVLAFIFMPTVVGLMAPGFADDPMRFPAAVELTRITFPYLALVSLVILMSGVLNAVGRFAAAAATQVVLNVGIIGALLLAANFRTPAHAAAWGIVVAGLLQFLVVTADALKANVMLELRAPKVTPEVRQFWKTFVPATLGSAGTQIAVLADTVVASYLVAGSVSWLYYADRLNQLPLGVIAIAVGTVLLSEMSRRVAAGDEAGARTAQLRAIELTLVFTLPAVAAFVIVPDTLMQALFMRGEFSANDAMQSARALAAYGSGLAALVLIRPLTVTFHSRGDTKTPVIAVGVAITVNVLLKVLLMGPLGHVGLAVATSAGAWINLAMLIVFARRRELLALDERAKVVMPQLAVAFSVLALALVASNTAIAMLIPGRLGDKLELVLLMAIGGIAYGGALAVLFGKRFLADLKRLRRGIEG
ncbi:murein biosynthesis integral membrane protein MurJ [Phreatobacter sp.]|uniref:murein biosynthesis integral membrane protein MurJ n=1 Tax=Phreatobacter sp. TaxID=1966341 RepID=UPI0022BC47D9|nr:murein biosynthesis integral membrane protein MurJ [Phreatobacter sp.]MCZ8314554.1 murein biosynthesis integral membrane protein MurJ [Phreatobacter sp.]